MKVEYYQNGELIVTDAYSLEFANKFGDVLIQFTDNKADYLIIDRDNFINAHA